MTKQLPNNRSQAGGRGSSRPKLSHPGASLPALLPRKLHGQLRQDHLSSHSCGRSRGCSFTFTLAGKEAHKLDCRSRSHK